MEKTTMLTWPDLIEAFRSLCDTILTGAKLPELWVNPAEYAGTYPQFMAHCRTGSLSIKKQPEKKN